MEQHSHLHAYEEVHGMANTARAKRGQYFATLHRIFQPLKKNFLKNLILELAAVGRVFAIVQASVFGIFLFLLDFEVVTEWLGILMPPLTVFLIGTYLTLLPAYIVMPLVVGAVYKPKAAYPVMGLSVLLSLIIVFLI